MERRKAREAVLELLFEKEFNQDITAEETYRLAEESREQKSLRLQQLLGEMIAQAVQNNNHELCEEIKESLVKELDYQFRAQEEREEERERIRDMRNEEYYKRMDELLRKKQEKKVFPKWKHPSSSQNIKLLR